MRYVLLFIALFFTACSIKEYDHVSTKIVTIKTPTLKFSDIGYLRNLDDAVELELFIAGHVFKKIDINHLICVSDEGCMSKDAFNAEYLSKDYPAQMLQNVLLGREIFQGKNLQKTASGFTQNILTQALDITYRVEPKEIYFKDRKNHILFRIKDTQ